MPKLTYVYKKLGKSYLIWFKNSNQYFYLEKPAWYVFRYIQKKHKSQTIAKEVACNYGFSYEESLNFVKEIRQKVKDGRKQSHHKKYIERFSKEINSTDYSTHSRHMYNMHNKNIEFIYETDWLESWIHPLIKHLETNEISNESSLFELFTFKNRVIFKVDKVLKGSWEQDESPYVKGRVFVELLNALHNKKDEDWLMTVHASAVSNGKKTILFSASAGSGKTTFAALLQTLGYHIISDDFVPIEKSTLKAYPLPIAMSIKAGSMDLLKSHYPELSKNSYVKINSKKKIKYLPVDTKMMNMIFPIDAFVFIKYDESVDFSFEKTEPVEAFIKLFEEAWIPPESENARIFFDKIINIPFYNLTYSNNEKALEAIKQMFENDKK